MSKSMAIERVLWFGRMPKNIYLPMKSFYYAPITLLMTISAAHAQLIISDSFDTADSSDLDANLAML